MQFQLRVPEGFRGRIYTHKVVVVAVVAVVAVVVASRIYAHKVTNWNWKEAEINISNCLSSALRAVTVLCSRERRKHLHSQDSRRQRFPRLWDREGGFLDQVAILKERVISSASQSN